MIQYTIAMIVNMAVEAGNTQLYLIHNDTFPQANGGPLYIPFLFDIHVAVSLF